VGIIVGDISIVETSPSNELVTAVLNDDLENVKARVMMRARVNARDKSREGMSPLHAAVSNGNVEIAEFLLNQGAKVNLRDYEKRTPLMMMDEDATPEMFDLLIRFSAKTALFGKQKNSLLHYLATNGAPAEIVRRAVNYGLNVNAVNKEGKTPLMLAVQDGEYDIAKALIESGADVNIRARDGRTVADLISAESELGSLLATYGAVRRIE
jgi:ankyrin repeat protein